MVSRLTLSYLGLASNSSLGPNKSGGRPDQALLDEINRRVLADRIISALEPTARPAARERENLERQAWENSHHSLSSNA